MQIVKRLWQNSSSVNLAMLKPALYSLALLCGACSQMQTQDDEQAVQSPSTEEQIKGPYTDPVYDGPSVVTFARYSDPLQPVNRALFGFNDVIYRYMLSPLASGYIAVTPKPVNKSLGNFFKNLREPLYSINHLLQGEFRKSGTSLVRFGLNSTLGLLGLFDPADSWMELERRSTTFGQTLATYGVGYGAYFVIPVLGPSTLRDGASTVYEYYTHPAHYILETAEDTAYFVAEGFHDMASTLKHYPKLVEDADDPYLFIRNLYLQRLMRDDEATIREVKNGGVDPPLYE